MEFRHGRSLALGAAISLVGCGGGRPSNGPLRLVDLFAEAEIEHASSPGGAPAEGVAWTFGEIGAADDATAGWRASGVDGLAIRDGRLHGRATAETPLIWAERRAPVDEDDLLHAVEIALRVSEGGELAGRFDSGDEPDIDRALADTFPWPLVTPLVPGDEVQRYTLRPSRAVRLSRVRHLLLRPADVEGAVFEIESVRMISRREHLAGIRSGVGWHGVGDIYRESIVTRAPESVSFELTLPEKAWLDLAVATIEDGVATFRVEVKPAAGEPLTFERTVTRPHRWDPAVVRLDDLAGRKVTLSLGLSSETDGFLGLWGTTTIRSDAANPSSRNPQGVIVVVGDTLRADHFSALGYARETSPVLTSLASGGVLARDCVSQGTWTKVSVPSIFTSLYPTTHTVKEFTDRLPASAVTMAELFREAGYATLALTSISFTGQFTNLHQGYEELHESSSLRDSSDSKTAREYVDRLLPWLELHRNVPFFVFLHVADPHSPYRAYEPFDTLWGRPGDAAKLEEHIETVRPHIQNPVMKRFGMPTRSELEKAGVDPEEFVRIELDAYDGSIRAMDIEIGRLLERLDHLDLADRTLIAFVSDHGTEFLDHDEHFHGQSVYGELNRVPLMLWGPGVVPGGIVLDPTVQTIDLMPTVLELVGLKVPDAVQGRSLVPLMRAAERGREQDWPWPAVTEKAMRQSGDLPGRHYESVSLIADGWKLIRNDPAPPGGNEYELYDHRADPLNRRDLATEHRERVDTLAELLREWTRQVQAEKLDDELVEQNLDDAELERLRSLGYLQ